MRIITIEEHIPGAAIAAAASIGAAKDAPYMAKASGKGLPYVPDGTMFDICEKRVGCYDYEIPEEYQRYPQYNF